MLVVCCLAPRHAGEAQCPLESACADRKYRRSPPPVPGPSSARRLPDTLCEETPLVRSQTLLPLLSPSDNRTAVRPLILGLRLSLVGAQPACLMVRASGNLRVCIASPRRRRLCLCSDEPRCKVVHGPRRSGLTQLATPCPCRVFGFQALLSLHRRL